jgi:hypothetical protein
LVAGPLARFKGYDNIVFLAPQAPEKAQKFGVFDVVWL